MRESSTLMKTEILLSGNSGNTVRTKKREIERERKRKRTSRW